MSGEVTDFRNTEYKKVRVVMGENASAEYVRALLKDGWLPEKDDEWTRFISRGEEKVYILTFQRPRKVP